MAENKEGGRTLRAFLDGEEPPNEENYFAYSASLRIFGKIPDVQGITDSLGIEPTYTHFRGERKISRSPPFEHDMWNYSPALPETSSLEEHINQLWAEIEPHKEYLIELKNVLTVDVFLGYRSNCDTAGIEVPHESLKMFAELEVPFGLSIIIT
jgi:hypothetical protein